MAVSKTRKKSPRRKPRGEVKRVPKVYSIKYKFIRGSYKPKLDVVELYINMQVNDENIVVHGDVDPDKSYFDGLYIHTANPHAGLTARTAWINKRDVPNLTMAVRAFVDTIGDLLDNNTPVEDLPCLSINDKGAYFGEDRLYDIAKVY
jgi:hypothetical protein